MPISIGSRLGPYEIVAPLGAGGMGEVYKARDTRLNRFVAIKVLPPERVADEGRKQRFIQEAQAASALNHPNIVSIYDIAIADGRDYMVMEYVPGKTLDALIPRAGMRLGELLKIAIPVAEGLSAAHAAGIVHRDLKPTNVIVAENGLVKILDFGLAKLTERTEVEEDAATRTLKPATDAGTVLGTAAYMSPEQAEGKAVDGRSDIFSFGAVLYEMATGRRAFTGDSNAAIMAAVLNKEPRPPHEMAPEFPAELERIVVRCLRKDPDKRQQHMKDMKVLLEELREETESGKLAPAAVARARRPVWVWAVAAAVMALVGMGLWVMSRRTAPLPPQRLVPVTTYPGSEMYPSFSPDGNQIAFYWDGDKGANPGVYVKLVGETGALRLTTGPDSYPAWSPDGKRIAFVRGEPEAGVYTVSALGGAVRKVAGFRERQDRSFPQVSWSPDGAWLSISLNGEKNRGIFLLPAEGGEPRRITNPKSPAVDVAAAFAPRGHRLAYGGCASEYSCDVYLQELDSGYLPQGSPRPITRLGQWIRALAWSRDGGAVIFSAGYIMRSYLLRANVDGSQAAQRLEIAGPHAYSPSASPTADRLVFSRELGREAVIWRYRVGGGMEPFIVSSLAINRTPNFSPDGTRIAFESDRAGEGTEIWVAQADGSNPVQLTNRLGQHQGTPRWSPDGRWIAFDSLGQDGHWHIYTMEATGSSPRRVTSEASDENMPLWSRDGKWIYLRSQRTGRFEIWRIPVAGGQPEQVTKHGGHTAYDSDDGKTLFYTKATYGPLFARNVAGGDEKQLLPYIHDRLFFPMADGVYYVGRQSSEGYYPLEFFQLSTATSRLLGKIEGRPTQCMTVSPDRKTILFGSFGAPGADLMMIENFR